MEDFVPYELALKLKDKGFRKPCIATYDKDRMLGYNYVQPTSIHAVGFEECLVYSNDCVMAPTISQVLKWLREEKDIDIVISPVFFYDGVLGKMREYGCKVFTPSLNKPEHCGYHEEWEQAAIAGIEYVLDNLI